MNIGKDNDIEYTNEAIELRNGMITSAENLYDFIEGSNYANWSEKKGKWEHEEELMYNKLKILK